MELDVRNCFAAHPKPCVTCEHYRSHYYECLSPLNWKPCPIGGKIRIHSAHGARHDEAACGYNGRWYMEEKASFITKLFSHKTQKEDDDDVR